MLNYSFTSEITLRNHVENNSQENLALLQFVTDVISSFFFLQACCDLKSEVRVARASYGRHSISTSPRNKYSMSQHKGLYKTSPAGQSWVKAVDVNFLYYRLAWCPLKTCLIWMGCWLGLWWSWLRSSTQNPESVVVAIVVNTFVVVIKNFACVDDSWIFNVSHVQITPSSTLHIRGILTIHITCVK